MFEVLGMTPTLRCRDVFKTIWAGDLPYLTLNYWIVSSLSKLSAPVYPSPLPSGVCAKT